jgi:enterochelin esterase family protein
VPGTPAPFIFSADSYGLRDRQLANILDNMISDHRLPVTVANGGPERSLVSRLFADFVESEVLPRVEKETGVQTDQEP